MTGPIPAATIVAMDMRAVGRNLALVVGFSAALVLATAGFFWQSFVLQYHLYRLRREPKRLVACLDLPMESFRGKALRQFLKDEPGKRALLVEFIAGMFQELKKKHQRPFLDQDLTGKERILFELEFPRVLRTEKEATGWFFSQMFRRHPPTGSNFGTRVEKGSFLHRALPFLDEIKVASFRLKEYPGLRFHLSRNEAEISCYIWRPRTVEDLLEALRSKDPPTCFEAIEDLEELGLEAQGAVDSLEEMLTDTSAETRCAAAEALLWIGLDLLKQGDAKSRLRGVQGLGEFGNRMGMHVPALDAALKDGDERVRHAAAEALKKIHGTRDETER